MNTDIDSEKQKVHDTAAQVVSDILDAYSEYQTQFQNITRRANDRFNSQDWEGMRRDALERLDLYPKTVDETVFRLKQTTDGFQFNEAFGRIVKSSYSLKTDCRDDCELAETFFNSVVRRMHGIVGVNPNIEYIAADFKILEIEDRLCPVCEAYDSPNSDALILRILDRYKDQLTFEHQERDARRIASVLDARLDEFGENRRVDHCEMIESVFYRDKAAYLIGRIRTGEQIFPLIIALLNGPDGVHTDAVLTTGDDISILFSFTRAYFHVLVDNPSEMVNFLKTIIPHKRVSETYTSLGFHKHGKAELYREIIRDLEQTSDQFIIAPGQEGMVMLVFTLPSLNVVFKIIKDHFEYPKKATRKTVLQQYRLVFRHDRAGRLVDAQEFEHLEFPKERFSEEVLEAFRITARETVEIRGDRVCIRHLYTERRLIPLDIFIHEADEADAREAVIDYGRCIKELASTNIFTGDLFLKNFGVTRHGRVVFYDYDELSLITDCRFRKIPPSRGYEDDLSSEPWFHVRDEDVFPEEFRTFLRFPPHLKEAFESVHRDLYDVGYWKAVQARLASGRVIHVYPYVEGKRFK
jgi:isocitrate dehydrogenase kinase/phosphatase